MTKFEIFDEVVDIMAHDSATCKDIKGADPAPFRARISEEISDRDFANLVNEYLCSFGLTGHLDFIGKSEARAPFLVKRYDDRLYVIFARTDSGVEKGDIITHINGASISETAEKYSFMLTEKNPERQGLNWFRIMRKYADNYTVYHKSTGTTETREYKMFTGPDKNTVNDRFFCKKISDDTALIRLPDFLSFKTTENLVKENRRFLNKCSYIIFDVRGNAGGSDLSFRVFEPYCFPKGKNRYAVDWGSERLYSQRNCMLKAELTRTFDYPEKEKDARKYEEKAGKGWEGSAVERITVKGRKNPRKVYVITDEDCGSSGDSFVETMRLSPKVTVAGRPTAGINDYSDCVIKDYDVFIFMYPHSRL